MLICIGFLGLSVGWNGDGISESFVFCCPVSFMTIENSRSVFSIVHDNRRLEKRGFYCFK